MESTVNQVWRKSKGTFAGVSQSGAAVWALPVLLCLGCGGGSTAKVEKLVPASGKVQLDGKPTQGIRLIFQPVTGTNAVGGSWGITDDEGKFKVFHLSKKEGLPPGKYEVLLSRKVKADGSLLGPDESPTMVQSFETISKMYSDPSKAGLHNRIDVPEKGNNNIDFKVSSVPIKTKPKS